MQALLDRLQLKSANPGACTGPDGWIADEGGSELISLNPTTGEPIASVIQASTATYDGVVAASQEAFADWRMVPAPKRGLVVRDLGKNISGTFHIKP